MSRAIGANLESISSSATVRRPSAESSLPLTLPMFTPAMRTSASCTSSDASGSATLTR